MWLSVAVTILAGYLLGNMNGAIFTSKLMHDDVRKHGSGNAGLTNFIRNYGPAKALLVILIDGLKGTMACIIGGLLLNVYGYRLEGMALGGAAVMLGHTFPVLLGFRGGKGILSGLFIAITVDWRIALLILAVFAIAYFPTMYVSLGSVLAATAFALGFVIFHSDNLTVMLCGIFMGTLAVFMHRENIVRLIQKKERKTNLFKKG